MTLRDQIAIVIRSWLLILAFSLALHLWRLPEGWQRDTEIVILVLALNIREYVSYYWRREDRTLWGRVKSTS